jgi:hypothetical protein
MARQGLRAYAEQVAAAGRHGDTELAHLSPDEIAVLNTMQGHVSINPDTGLPEFFSLKKILKGVGKAAAGLVGGYFGGPAGAAVGAGLASKLFGDSTSKALTTGLLAGLGSYGAQQTGIGDFLGGGFSSSADLLGQEAASAGADAASGAIQTASGTAGGGGSGMGLTAALPLLLGGASALAGAGKSPKVKAPDAPDEQDAVQYEPLDRTQLAYQGDPYSYGQFDPEFQYFDEVNPGLDPLQARRGGRVHFAMGGSTEARDPAGPHGDISGGSGGHSAGLGGGGDNSGGRKSDQPPHAGTGGGQTAGLGNIGGFHGLGGNGGDSGIDYFKGIRGAGSFATPTGAFQDIPNKHIREGIDAFDQYKNRNGLWDLADTLMGPLLDVVQPKWSKIGTYAGGTWHTGTSVPGTIGMIGGALGGVPLIGGPLGQWIGDQLGIDDVLHGGYSDIPDWAKSDQTGAIHGPQGGTGNGGNANVSGLPANRFRRGIGIQPSEDQGTPAPKGGGDDVITGQDRQQTTTDAGRTFSPLTDPYTYGQFGPEHNFFTDELNMRGGGGVSGPGTGQSDEIPAMLSNGEYVVDAESVSALGDGSTDAGAKKLDALRHNLRKHKRATKPHAIPPKAKGLTAYMNARAA